MIPHTPLLLITGAHALRRHATVLRRWHPELPCSLEFVQAVGWTSHDSLVGGRSSWPIEEVTTVAALRELAQERRWVRERAEPGDLVLLPPAREGSEVEVGIVMQVLERGLMDACVRRCAILVARSSGSEMRLDEEVRWLDSRSGQLSLRWYAFHDEVERAA